MGIIRNLFNSNKIENKHSKTAPITVQVGNNQPSFTPRRYDKFAEEGFQKNVIVYRCIKLIAQNAASIPWAVYDGQNRLHEHPLISLLQKPNPTQSKAELFEAIYSYYLISGNSYLEAVGPADSPPHELWSLRPDHISIIPGTNGIAQAYRYSVNGKEVDFKVNQLNGHSEILHMKAFNPLSDWYGMSPMEAAAFSVDQHNDASIWNKSLLETSGRPSGALVYNPTNSEMSTVLTEEQRLALREELEAHYTGINNSGRPLVLEGGLDWKEMALSPKDMDFISGKDVSAREIALAFNVPAQLVGVNGSLTYANFEQARLALYDDAVIPLLSHIRDELNNWLIPIFGEGLRLDFDLDKVEALSVRRDKIWNRLQSANFMTVNEKRAELGLSPIENGDSLDVNRI